ncbi:MAG: hydroxymethylglutaryl-CoA lyase [Planctomycetaceae bacterium]|nr:hydroxymethylglutaryl-CoA lyase [Planctomycetaceae bacterium]
MPQVKLVEIGPRDGFQSVNEFIPTSLKTAVIDRLVEAGLRKIQITSFVSPKAIPQMKGARQVSEYVLTKYPAVEPFALVPNLTGAKMAVAAGLKEIGPVMSLSESHNMANIRRSVEESLEETKAIRQQFPDTKITQDIATVFGCPFEGRMRVEPLLELLGRLHAIGIRDFTLCDTIGVAYPKQVTEVFQKATAAFPDCGFGAHIHDTRNMGILNSYLALQNGASSVQTAIGGLGGCPFAPGASGNTATEDISYMLEREGYATGLDMDKLVATARFLQANVAGNYSGHHAAISAEFREMGMPA